MDRISRSASARSTLRIIVGALGLFALAACDQQQAKVLPPLPVSVIEVEPRTFQIYEEFVGEVRGSQEVDVRSRVSGILLATEFLDGTLVEAGQPLFNIDDRQFVAQVHEAQGVLAAAKSDLARAQLDVDRYEKLALVQSVSEQVRDNARALVQAKLAEVEASSAALEQAKLNVEYASILAPVSGRIGAAAVDDGDLIQMGSTLLARISNSNPAWVNFRVSESALLDYESRHGVVGVSDQPPTQRVELYLGDGERYPHLGNINFTDRAFNQSTGTYRIRAEFANPDSLLRPGIFARVRVITDELKDSILVPDKAVIQLLDRYFIMIANENDEPEMRAVSMGSRQDGLWVVDAGLEPGERVIVEGIQKARLAKKLAVSVEPNNQYFANQYVLGSEER